MLDAALTVIRTKGYGAATVDDICRAAGLSKGSFFHYFRDKEALAIAAAEHFSAGADALFAAAEYRDDPDPRDRVLRYADLRAAMVRGDLAAFTCLLGTMVQETYATHPAIREACDQHIRHHADAVAQDLEAAKRRYAADAPWTAESMALFTQAVIQGAFILAKAHDDPGVAVDCMIHLRRYLESQLPQLAQATVPS
ncbi:MAG TPA: helix-turn-helix domain-containing protein [Candidatus Elarobacter sp.]|nr:helix-turn-helix domain-containing protein [Candidatus Elarobacter sp.]